MVDPSPARTVHRARARWLAEPGAGFEAVQAPQQVSPVPCPAWGMADACAAMPSFHHAVEYVSPGYVQLIVNGFKMQKLG